MRRGHADAEGISRYPCVAFYANEHEARIVHIALLDRRDHLTCSWVLSGGFVHDRTAGEWRLGWTLECCGIIESVDEYSQFNARTIKSARVTDIPSLIQMFAELTRRT